MKTKENKKPNYMELNNMLLKYQWVSDEIKEIRKCFETNNIDKTTSQNLWDVEKAILREVYRSS